MNKLLIICGPTATGKTNLALHLSKLFTGEILSADSRQIYKGMNIGTGKDLPLDAILRYPINNLMRQNIGCYRVNDINIWGYDLIDPIDEFSVSQYIRIANSVILNVQNRGKLPILVGGTGFYIKGVTDGIATSQIPPNLDVRIKLQGKSPKELLDMLTAIDSNKSSKMNQSDRKNPRRLIRAIEIAMSGVRNQTISIELNNKKSKMDSLFVGLLAGRENINEKIENRVKNRIEIGSEREVKGLLENGVTWEMKSMNAMGYKEWKPYFKGLTGIEGVTERWILDEVRYSKRQLTWFKKDERINWFDINSPTFKDEVENLVRKWNNKTNAKES